MIMSVMQNMAIKHKLMSIIMVTCAAALLLASIIQLLIERREYREETVDKISCYAEMIGDNCKAALAFEDAKDTQETLTSLQAESSIVFSCVYTKEGKVLAHYHHPEVTAEFPPPVCKKEGHKFDKDYFKLFKHIKDNDEIIGTVYIQFDLHEMKAMFWLKTGTIALVVLTCSLVVYLVSSRLQGIISKPILSLTEVAKRVSDKKDYSTRALKRSNDEVGQLIDSFNEMLEQIQQRDMQLVEINEDLEIRVKERTADLTITNKQLTTEVAERVKAEEKQRQVAEEWKTTFDSIVDMVSIHNKDFKIVKVNKSFANACNMKQEEIIGKSCYELIHGTKEPPPFCPHKRTVDTGKPNHREFFEPRLGIHIEASTSPLFDENGQIIASVHIAKDITERKQAEEGLRESENRYRILIENIPQKVFLKDRNSVYVSCNKNYAADLDIEPEEIAGMTDFDFYSKELADKYRSDDSRVVESAQVKEIDEKYVQDGKERIVHTVKTPVKDEHDNVVGVLGIFWDITERKEAEAKLKATQDKLIETARKVGMAEVAADILHNVGNVLNSINVSATVIREKVNNSELASLEKVASIINEHADDLGRFLTEHPQGKHIPVYLTEVSKCLQNEQTDIIERLRMLAENVQHIKDIVNMQQSYAKVSGVEVQTSLSKLVEDAIQINSAGLERHGTRLIREFEELGDVEIDKQKVLQILVNLISNAKYALSGSKREEKLLTIRIYKHGEARFRIEVADNGVGISKDNLTKIFSHGFTTKKDGHGFGLHSCALTSSEMGGSLTVHSDGRGHGATFTLELPFKTVGAVV